MIINPCIRSPRFILFSLILLLTLANVKSETIHLDQRKQLFNYDWKFSLDDSNGISPDMDDANWRQLDLPHDWSIEGAFDAKNPMGNDGGYLPAGIAWYRKHFSVPADLEEQQFTIYFEGVYMNAEVYLNGTKLGIQPYGYSSFYFDMTPYIKVGEENVLAVKVDNSKHKNCRWYSGSGIYRNVWLYVTNPVFIEKWSTFITTPKVSEKEAKVEVQTAIKNQLKKKAKLTLKLDIIDAAHKKVATSQNTITLNGGQADSAKFSLPIQNPRLWDTENPELYMAKIKVLQKGKVLDEISQPFGIRSIAYSAEKGFQLNGKDIILYGGCVHHDNGSLGAAAYDRAEIKKVQWLKDAGFNSVRTSHNPPSEAFLDACDSIGLLVIDEAFDGWRTEKTPFDYHLLFDEWAEKDIAAMVKRDRNHPSIIMWSIGNEIIERKSPEAVKTAHSLRQFVRNNDTTRPVTSAMTTWDNDWAIFDPLMAEHDICGYNYQLHQSEEDHKRAPERVIVQTESYPREAFANYKLVMDHPYIIGDFVWTAIDYLGESGIGRYFYKGEPEGQHWEQDFFPWHGAYCGDIDLTGWRKPISHYRSLLFSDQEKLYIGVKEPNGYHGEIHETMWSVWPTWESWTWPGHEGKDIEVEVYSRYDRVQLLLNDSVIGEKPTGIEEEYKAIFTLPYTPGKLEAKGMKGTDVAETFSLSTAGEAAKIKMTADRTSISADGQDLVYITLEITDKNGTPDPNANNEININIKGPAVLVGTNNASLQDTTVYTSSQRKVWKGRAMAIVKSTRDAGDIIIKASSNGLPTSTIQIISDN